MKIIEKLKIILNRILNKIFKVTNVEKLEAQRDAMQEMYDNSKEQLNELQASKKLKKEELDKKKKQLTKLETMNKELLEKGNDKKLKEGFEFKKQLDYEIELLENTIKSYTSLTTNLKQQLTTYKSKIDRIHNNIDALKAKAEFSESVDKFKETMKNLDCRDINDISNEIDKNYYKSEFDLNDLVKCDKKVEDFVNDDDSDFENYKKSLKKKSDK